MGPTGEGGSEEVGRWEERVRRGVREEKERGGRRKKRGGGEEEEEEKEGEEEWRERKERD